MVRWFSFQPNLIDEASFRPSGSDWTFEAPNPWPLAPPKRYLVSEQQKAEIMLRLARTRRGAVVLLLALLGASLAIPVLSATAFGGSLIQNTVTLSIVMLVGGYGIGAYYGLMLRPLVAGLPAAAERGASAVL
jgi:hypothetical protein